MSIVMLIGLDDKKSTSEFCIFLILSLVSWSSGKQKVSFRSSKEAEFRALAHTIAKVAWVLKLFKELQVLLTNVLVLFCENVSVRCLARNPVSSL